MSAGASGVTLACSRIWAQMRMRERLGLAAAAVACALMVIGMSAPSAFADSSASGAGTSIVVDGTHGGRVFDGEGAISGGGATSRLLTDYSRRAQRQILDYLFKPDFGASLQQFKVEIGSGANTTEGSEASIEPVRGQINCNAGYEWWLMEQAQRRNPEITLGGLEWGAPGWFRADNGQTDDAARFFSQDNIDYILAWLGCARQHGLRIDNVGVWNEHRYDAGWIERLRGALDGAGYGSVRIVAADLCCGSEWDIASDMTSDSALYRAVSIVGAHYPGNTSTPVAQNLGKPLWASEDGPWSAAWGATNPAGLSTTIAQDLNLNYVNGRMTSTQIWNLVTAYYDNLSTPGAGLMLANTPWSGGYEVQSPIWIMAQTTQFAHPGWRYIDSASGDLDPSGSSDGSYVTLRAPHSGDWSTVVETMTATAPRTVTLRVQGGLAHRTLHVWRTTATDWLRQLPDLRPGADGSYTLTVDPSAVYTVTSTLGQEHGSFPNEPSGSSSAPFPFPYADSFRHDRLGQQPPYFYQMLGEFPVERCRAERHGNCLTQIDRQPPIPWGFYNGTEPLGTLGDPKWTDYQVSVDTLVPTGAGMTQVLGRAAPEAIQGGNTGPEGYALRLQADGNWSLGKMVYAGGTSDVFRSLQSGALADGAHGWHTLSLRFAGAQIAASIDHVQVAQVSDAQYASGMVELGSGWNAAQFGNLRIEPVGRRDRR